MVAGLDVFREYFADDIDKYVLIGGADPGIRRKDMALYR